MSNRRARRVSLGIGLASVVLMCALADDAPLWLFFALAIVAGTGIWLGGGLS